MIKKILDGISLVSLAVFFGIIVWAAIWGEGPREAGHLSIQSKIVAWDAAPVVFGGTWLIIRFAKVAAERFPRVFGHRGLLFYFVLVFGGGVVFVHWFSIVREMILSKLAGG